MLIKQKGFSIVELLMVMGLAAIIFPALLTGFVATRSGRAQGEERLQAIHLVEEAQEAVRIVREKDWTDFTAYSIPPNQIYHPVHPVASSTWTLVNGPETINGLTRQITISDVSRDNSTNLIVADDAPQSFVDPSTKKVTITVFWSNPLPAQVSSTMYLTRYLSNDSFADKSVNDFAKGLFTSTETLSPSNNPNSDDGQIVLAQSGAADWCDPGNNIVAQIPLDKNQGFVATKVVAGINKAFAGTGKSKSGEPLYNINIPLNAQQKPEPALVGFYDAGGLKTHDLFGESHFAYIAPESNSNEEVVIVDVNSDTPIFVSSVIVPGNTGANSGANSVFVVDNTLYFVGNNNKLYTYSMSADRKTLNPQDSIPLGGSSSKMFVTGGYVFLAMDSNSDQLQVVDARDPTKLKKLSPVTVNDQPAIGIFVLDDLSRAYILTKQASSSNFFIIKDPTTSPSIFQSGFSTGAMDPRGLTVIENRAVMVGFGGNRYIVLKVKDSSGNDAYENCTPNFTADDDIHDVSSIRNNTHAYSYIVSDNNDVAFQIIEGGLGGVGGYVPSGSYESGISWTSLPMPTTLFTAFNHFDVTFIKPTGTDIQFQVSVADAVGGSCSSFSYVGAGQPPTTGFFPTNPGDNNNPITQSFTIPAGSNPSGYLNPGKCFRYKANLSTNNSSVTPAIDNVTVNYSK